VQHLVSGEADYQQLARGACIPVGSTPSSSMAKPEDLDMLNPGPRLSISDAEFVSFVSERYSPPRTEYAKPRRPAAAAASAMCCAERYGRTAALAAQPPVQLPSLPGRQPSRGQRAHFAVNLCPGEIQIVLDASSCQELSMCP
jgi:hypothetical protein